jgi:hypothetical protein
MQSIKITLTTEQVREISYAINARNAQGNSSDPDTCEYLSDQFDNLRRFLNI